MGEEDASPGVGTAVLDGTRVLAPSGKTAAMQPVNKIRAIKRNLWCIIPIVVCEPSYVCKKPYRHHLPDELKMSICLK